MKGERRSAAEEKHLRWKEEEEEEEEEGWRCRKHPFQPRYGVCPACLRDRLLRLCPECANARPSCACAPFSSSSPSSSSSSSSSFSCLSFPADLPRSGTTGATGRASSLIEREPPFQRSGSVGVVNVPRSRSIAAATGGGGSGEVRRRGWVGLWPFASARNESAAEGWKWHFPSPMNLLRSRKSEASGRGRRCTGVDDNRR